MILRGLSIGDLYLDLNLNTKAFDSQLANVSKNAQKSITSSFGGLGKIVAGALSTAAIGTFVKSCLDLGSNLAEVQNVVDVTFPHMNAQVDEFAKNAIDKFGLSETVAKRMTGTYGSMAKAFGFSEQSAYDMATALTGLAGDVASFYNLDPTEAYTKLKSVFSGETETLKDLGIVMTQNALDQYALANGYGKTTSAMTEQEKVSLRLAFVTGQLSAASGDFARTSDSWANKVRVLSLNFQSLKATLGQGFINLLSPLISMLNNLIVKLNKAAQYFVAFTSLISGKKISTSLGSVSSSIDSASKGASNLANNVGGVGEAAKKAAKEMTSLASIDELNTLNTDDSSSGDSSGSGGGTGGSIGADIVSGTNDAVAIDTSKMEASIEKMKSMWNGFTSFLKKKKPVIISLISGIVAGFAAFETIKNWSKITGGINLVNKSMIGLLETFKAFIKYPNLVTTAFTGLSVNGVLVVAGIAAVTAALVYLYQTSDSFRKLVNSAIKSLMDILQNLYKKCLVPIFNMLGKLFKTILVPLASFIADVFVTAVDAVASVVLSFWTNILAPFANFLVRVLGVVIQGVCDTMEAWMPAISAVIGGLNKLWNTMLKPIVSFIKDTFIAVFKTAGTVLSTVADIIVEAFQGVVYFFVSIFTLNMDGAWEKVCGIFKNAWETICRIFSPLGKWFGQQWENVKIAFSNVAQWFGNVFGGAWSKICSAFSNVGKFFGGVWSNIKGAFGNVAQWFESVFGGAWTAVKNVFSTGGRIFDGIKDGILNGFKTVVNGIIGGINRVVKIPFNGINTALKTLKKVNILGHKPFDWISTISVPQIPKLAQGGYVKANTPQLAMIGDNKTQGEIVSPEGKMFEVMINALKSFEMSRSHNTDDETIDLLRQIISILLSILNKDTDVYIDRKKVTDEVNKTNKQKGYDFGFNL